MKCKAKREFTHRNFPRRFEAKPAARTKINKRKYYGVKINEKEYRKQINDHFYQPKLLDKLFKGSESLATKANQYLFQIGSTYDKLLASAKSILGDAYRKGSKRVIDNSGDTIKLDEPVDETTVDVITGQQVTYYDNLTGAQSRKINKIIEDGVAAGITDDEIAAEIKGSVKSISASRSRMIARTEIVKTHSIAQTETMKQAGVEQYNYITANDKKVSKICRKNQGAKGREKIYETALAGTPQNPLPVINSHPNCRCVPVAYFKP